MTDETQCQRPQDSCKYYLEVTIVDMCLLGREAVSTGNNNYRSGVLFIIRSNGWEKITR